MGVPDVELKIEAPQSEGDSRDCDRQRKRPHSTILAEMEIESKSKLKTQMEMQVRKESDKERWRGMGKECKATHIHQDSEEAILFLTHSLSLYSPPLSAAEGMWPWYLKTRSPIWPPDITSHHPITIYPRSQNATNTGGANQSPSSAPLQHTPWLPSLSCCSCSYSGTFIILSTY